MVRTIFVAGHALLPQQAAAQSVYDNLVITVEVEPKYFVIVAASCNLVTHLGQDYLARLLVGRSLAEGVDSLIRDVQTLYQGTAQSAIVAALKDLQRRFEAWKQSGAGISRPV